MEQIVKSPIWLGLKFFKAHPFFYAIKPFFMSIRDGTIIKRNNDLLLSLI
jgi:hypothetical protein